jgi:hypothetical protein
MPETISLSPKARFCANTTAAAAHSDLMATPAFQSAAASALLEYQYRTCPAEPTVLAIAASKLKGAQEFLAVLLNLGIPEQRTPYTPDHALEPPEQSLNRPYRPSVT